MKPNKSPLSAELSSSAKEKEELFQALRDEVERALPSTLLSNQLLGYNGFKQALAGIVDPVSSLTSTDAQTKAALARMAADLVRPNQEFARALQPTFSRFPDFRWTRFLDQHGTGSSELHPGE